MDYNIFKELKEKLNMLSRDIEDVKKKSIVLLEMKIIMSEVKIHQMR